MCKHFLREVHSCGCVKVLPSGGKDYKPPELCRGVKLWIDEYHKQPERPPQQYPIPAPVPCPQVEATRWQPGSVVISRLDYPCPAHQGIPVPGQDFSQQAIHMNHTMGQEGPVPPRDNPPTYQWIGIQGSLNSIGRHVGEDGPFREARRTVCKTKLVEDFAGNDINNVNTEALESADSSRGSSSPGTPGDAHGSSSGNLSVEFVDLHHEDSGFNEPFQLRRLDEELQHLIAGQKSMYEEQSNTAATHDLDGRGPRFSGTRTPSNLTQALQTPSTPHKGSREIENATTNTSRSQMMQYSSPQHDTKHTIRAKQGLGPRPLEHKNEAPLFIKSSVCLPDSEAVMSPWSQNKYSTRYRPREVSEIRRAERHHRRTQSI